MSNLYAIKDTTLSALGDAVRGKANGTSELPILNVENQYIMYSNAFPHSLPGYVKKVKITGFIDFSPFTGSGNTTAPANGTQGLGVASGNFSRIDQRLVRQDDSYEVLFEGYGSGVEMPSIIIEFETIVEGNQWAFVTTIDSSSPKEFYISFTAVGLDENGNEFKYTPLEMVDKVNGLETIPETALNITGYCGYKFSGTSWNWFINQLGDKITTNNINGAAYMFDGNVLLESIPFEINLIKDTTMSNMFSDCQKLKALPQVNIPALSTHISFTYMFNNCYCIRELPDWVGDFFENDYNLDKANSTFSPYNYLFCNCYSLRSIPDKVMKYLANPKMSSSYYGIGYCKPFLNCCCLDELLNIYCDTCSLTSNNFSGFFSKLSRVKNITFATNEDGTPVIRPWKSQTFDLTSYIGFNSIPKDITDYNSGITRDKEVKDDATYQALKNDPDWFSCNVNYSRYNHDSAVNTINSLPDCSATGTNTIKFKGASGALTDGGAINTLTEEEIAVAAAKGWTVTFA